MSFFSKNGVWKCFTDVLPGIKPDDDHLSLGRSCFRVQDLSSRELEQRRQMSVVIMKMR